MAFIYPESNEYISPASIVYRNHHHYGLHHDHHDLHNHHILWENDRKG